MFELKILPIFNRITLFSITSKSYRGHPEKLSCPEDRSRKSIAIYYYTSGRPQNEVEEFLEDHGTIFKARKGQDNKEETEFYFNERIKEKKKEKRKTKGKCCFICKKYNASIFIQSIEKVKKVVLLSKLHIYKKIK